MKTKAKEHILEIVQDVYNMEARISKQELLNTAKHYNDEFNYQLTEEELAEIVDEIEELDV